MYVGTSHNTTPTAAAVYMFGLRSLENSGLAHAAQNQAVNYCSQTAAAHRQNKLRSDETIPHLVIDTMSAVFH